MIVGSFEGWWLGKFILQLKILTKVTAIDGYMQVTKMAVNGAQQ